MICRNLHRGSNPYPLFGVDYDVGWVGWTYYPADILSEAIAYGERWERRQKLARQRWARHAKRAPVSHAFICTGPGTGIEAHMQTGVARFDIAKYSNPKPGDPKPHLYFRKPRGWTLAMGTEIANIASQTPPLDCSYDMRLIDAMALNYSLTGHALNVITRDQFKRVTCGWMRTPNSFICSGNVAYDLKQVPSLARLGCLRQPFWMTDPQQLFDDDEVFE